MYYIVYGFFYLLSLLPMRALYVISDGVYLLIYYVFGYRKAIVMGEPRNGIPGKNKGRACKDCKSLLS